MIEIEGEVFVFMFIRIKRILCKKSREGLVSSRSFSSDSSGQLHVLRHDGNSLGVDGAEVGVLEESNHVGLSSLLEGKDGRGLESEVGLEIGSDFSDESLERKLSDKELGGFLILSDHSKGDGSWSESVGLLHA